jgi:hypothetical protein
LNRHPQVFLTDESRIMSWLNRTINTLGKDRNILATYSYEFLRFFTKEMPRLIERFYADLGAKGCLVWGDKNPFYADPKRDPECFGLIHRLFPDGKFIHIVRDPRDVIASLLRKKWADFEEALDIWERHVVWSRLNARAMGHRHFMEVQYTDVTESGVSAFGGICRFLEIEMHGDLEDFLEDQRTAPTPYSKPTSGEFVQPSTPFESIFDDRQLEAMKKLCDRVDFRDEESADSPECIEKYGLNVDLYLQSEMAKPQWRHVNIHNRSDQDVGVWLLHEVDAVEAHRTRVIEMRADSTFEWGIQWREGDVFVIREGRTKEDSPSFTITTKRLEYFVELV